MSLLAVRSEVLEALRRLEVPFEDVTPVSSGHDSRHVVAVGLAQRDVLRSWGVPFEELQPDAAGGTAGASPSTEGDQRRRSARPEPQLTVEQQIIREALAAREE